MMMGDDTKVKILNVLWRKLKKVPAKKNIERFVKEIQKNET